MRPLLLCSLLLACTPEDKPTSTTSATDASSSSATAEVTTSGTTGTTGTTDGTTSTATSSSTADTTDATGTTATPVDCESLGEPTCLAEPACTAHYGAPRIPQNGMICADYKNQQFLVCGVAGPPCPPTVITVCPIGQPITSYDVASGCVPPGYEVCMDGPIAECP